MKKIALSLFLLLGAQMAMALSYTMEFTETELQQRVSAMIPIQVAKSGLTLSILDPQVRLLQVSDEVSVASPLEVLAPGGLKAIGYINVKGSISYDATKGEFFLKNPTISEMEVKGLPEKYRPYAREAAQLAIGKSLATRPIYTLRDGDLKHKFAKAVIQSVTVKNKKVLVVLEKWLGLLEQLFPKDKWSHGWVNVLGKARQS